MDRFIVKDDITRDKVWWGDINIPFSPEKFNLLYNKVINYLKDKDVFVRDCYACADINYQLNLRVINEYPWSNLFVYNILKVSLCPSEMKYLISIYIVRNPTIFIYGIHMPFPHRKLEKGHIGT